MDYTITGLHITDAEFNMHSVDVSIGHACLSVDTADLGLEVDSVDVDLDLDRIVEVAADDPDDLRALAEAVQAACDHAGVDMPGAFDGMGFEALSEALGLPKDAEPRRVLDYATRVVRAVKGLLYVFSTPG
tara:strand:+ start:1082 stop:1474 length:393 start_codon:yes stop_codon:yes gene_type:complete